MTDMEVRALKEEGIFIGSDFTADAKNKSHIDMIGKRKNFLADSRGVLVGKNISGLGSKFGICQKSHL